MKSIKELPRFDASQYIKTDEDIAWFMADAMKTGDPAYIAHVMGVVARAKGMSQIAKDTGLSREQLYRSFSESGNPTLKTLLAVMNSVGVKLSAEPANAKTSASRRSSKRSTAIGGHKRGQRRKRFA